MIFHCWKFKLKVARVSNDGGGGGEKNTFENIVCMNYLENVFSDQSNKYSSLHKTLKYSHSIIIGTAVY